MFYFKPNLKEKRASSAWWESGVYSLLRWVVGEGDSLLDVPLQARDSRIQQGLLLGGNVRQDIGGLLGSVGLQ